MNQAWSKAYLAGLRFLGIHLSLIFLDTSPYFLLSHHGLCLPILLLCLAVLRLLGLGLKDLLDL